MFDAEKTKDEIISWMKNFFEKNGKGCSAVVGISGGKDSSVTAALCAQALGKENVYGVLMPQGEQYDIDVSQELVNHLGIKHFTINIKDSVDALLASISSSGLSANKQAVINIPPRIRMTTLYAVSAIVNGRVANTCNLSEDWVGYSTKYGDAAGDFSPLAKLTVDEVKQIGRALKLPSKFVDKTPEDGLTGKTDEENLGFSYEVLDKYIREGLCDDEAVSEKIENLRFANAHKYKLIPSFNP